MAKTIDMPLCYFGEGHSPKLRRGEREDEKKIKNNGSTEPYRSVDVITRHLIRKPPVKTILTPLTKVIIESWKKSYAPS